MPPSPLPHSLSPTSVPTASSNAFAHIGQISLLILLVAGCMRMRAVFSKSKKAGTSMATEDTKEEDIRSGKTHVEKEPAYPQEKTPVQVEHETIFKPIYPWVLPPHPLPGPYDYPPPSLRRHSSAEDSLETPTETNTILYTRRVSTNSIPTRQSTLHGTVTTSHEGWRRNLWEVSNG
jgi:hypothetical protein